jgi:hypothetical protein
MEDGKRALWTRIVSEFELSGQSQRTFAEQRKIGLSKPALLDVQAAQRIAAARDGGADVGGLGGEAG